MGHHKTAPHNKIEETFKVGKDNLAKAAEQVESVKDVSGSVLQQRLHEITEAGSGALGDLRSGFGSAAKEVRSGLGTAFTQVKKSMTKAAGRFNGVLHLSKAGSGRAAH